MSCEHGSAFARCWFGRQDDQLAGLLARSSFLLLKEGVLGRVLEANFLTGSAHVELEACAPCKVRQVEHFSRVERPLVVGVVAPAEISAKLFFCACIDVLHWALVE